MSEEWLDVLLRTRVVIEDYLRGQGVTPEQAAAMGKDLMGKLYDEHLLAAE
jgi:hypothetical protein